MKTKQPTLPATKFADRRRRKKRITPENHAKMLLNERRRLEKLERHNKTAVHVRPEYLGLGLGLLAGCDPQLVGLVIGLSAPLDTKVDEKKE
jgi:hypothetical protein